MTAAQIKEHGYNAYTHGCRCETCTEAKREYMRASRARRYRRRRLVDTTGSGGHNYVPGIAHGYNGYQNHSCRCEECRTARAEYDRLRRRGGGT